jgi:hypothetical protein
MQRIHNTQFHLKATNLLELGSRRLGEFEKYL